MRTPVRRYAPDRTALAKMAVWAGEKLGVAVKTVGAGRSGEVTQPGMLSTTKRL